ncbi:MAG: GNAT family N-acetyltransferase [Actinomycetota bacterium]
MREPDLLRRIDAYLDAVPRSVVRTEEIGPFTLFVNEGRGWRYYARPRPGAASFSDADVEAVRRRQRELRQPQELEWVEELAPGVGPAARATGLEVATMPLMHLPRAGFRTSAPGAGVEIAFASPHDDVGTLMAVATLAFGAPGTGVGEIGTESLGESAANADPATVEFARERIAAGLAVTAVAKVDGLPVAVGTHQPVRGVTEIVGVGSLPAFRRRGLGAMVTSALVDDAFARGVETVFLSAGDATIARVYARVGFRTIGHVGAAAPPAGASP